MSDPLALLRTLSDEAPGLGSAADVAEVKRAVAAMRRGQRLTAASSGRRLSAGGWRRAAAVGALTLGLSSLVAGGWLAAGRGGEATAAGEGSGAVDAAFAEAAPPAATPVSAAPVSAAPFAAATALDGWAQRPVFEGIDSPRSAAVYELAGENLDLVMVVDETFNI